MDLKLILILSSLFLLSIPYVQSQGTCSVNTILSTQIASLFTANPTVTIGGAASSTINLGSTPSAVGTNTINIGGTGSTVNIGPIPSAAPSPFPTVTINGINPTSWSSWVSPTGTPGPTVYATAGQCRSMKLTTTNSNLRPGTPSPAPTTTAYITSCPSLSPAISNAGITSFGGTSDCMVFPIMGFWSITLTINMWYNYDNLVGTGTGFISLLPATATSAPSVTDYTVFQEYNLGGGWAGLAFSVNRLVNVTVTSSTAVLANTFYFCYGSISAGNFLPPISPNNRFFNLQIEYLGL